MVHEEEDAPPAVRFQVGFQPAALFLGLGQRPVHDRTVQHHTVNAARVEAVPRTSKGSVPGRQRL
jgi:hypothetical protein